MISFIVFYEAITRKKCVDPVQKKHFAASELGLNYLYMSPKPVSILKRVKRLEGQARKLPFVKFQHVLFKRLPGC